MLIIRKEQIMAFERIDSQTFDREMMDHIQEHFPKYVEVVGETTILNRYPQWLRTGQGIRICHPARSFPVH